MQKDWSNHTVLIVEDDQISKKYFDIILRSSNIKTIHVSDGVSAFVRCLKDPSISIVLMDIKLPRLNGLDATKLIKRYRQNIPVIAQTASALNYEKELCLKFGCDGFIAKPIIPKQLIALMDKILILSNVSALKQLASA
jgi:CheY-like chemotaxis protein